MSRSVVAALLAGSLGGCVIPVGPEWSDPDRNYPPTVAYANPPVGTILGQAPDGGTSDAGAPIVVAVELADQNTGDNLYVRWIIDYPAQPPADPRVALLFTYPGGDAVTRQPPLYFAPDCARVSHAASSHRLMLAVSDRPFPKDQSSPDPDWPDAVPEGQYRVEAVWPFELSCQ
jgi:hypothetical protein